MQSEMKKEAICKSIFKNAKEEERAREFNRRWIEWIDRMEEAKEKSMGERQGAGPMGQEICDCSGSGEA